MHVIKALYTSIKQYKSFLTTFKLRGLAVHES